jgi:hypothetical protein
MWTSQEIDILKENFGKVVAKDIPLSYSPDAIRKKAFRLGLDGNQSKLASMHNSIAKKKYHHDEHFFSIPSILNSYYAGFIAADGCVTQKRNKLQICIHSKDVEILESFTRDIQYTGPIKIHQNIYRYLAINAAATICDDLKKNFSITPAKSLTLMPPNITDKRMMGAYLIGLIDGDGSIDKVGKHNYFRISICGTKSVLLWAKRFFDVIMPSNHPSNVIHCSNSNIYRYSVVGERAIQLYNYLMKIKVPRLSRKWNQ